MQSKHQGAKGGFGFAPFSMADDKNAGALRALFAMSTPASGHP